MSVESGDTISDLDSSWPLPGDFIQEGDDHLRLIKNVLKNQFQSGDGNGLGKPVTASADEMNHLSGQKSNIKENFDALTSDYRFNLYAPSGTRMMFVSSSVPVGWTKSTQFNDYMLRMVSGTGGGSGGNMTPTSFDVSHRHTTGDHQLTVFEMPNHTHPLRICDFNSGSDEREVRNYGGIQLHDLNPTNVGFGFKGEASNTLGEQMSGYGGDGVHNHGDTSYLTKSFTPRYLNTILGVKN